MRTLLTGVAAVLALASPAAAIEITYPDFSSANTAAHPLQLNGNAEIVGGNVLRLTGTEIFESGSAFSQTQVQTATFSTAFSFRITDPDAEFAGADGLVFVVQNQDNTVGGAGGGIGYEGIAPSIAVEFDTWQNEWDPDDNHVGIDIYGSLASDVTANPDGDFEDGSTWYAWVDYNGTTLEVRTNNTGVRPGGALLSYDVDLTGLLGGTSAYIGFTSGTGAGYANHDILSWTYRDTFDPIDVPEPASMALLGMAVLAGARRARRRGR